MLLLAEDEEGGGAGADGDGVEAAPDAAAVAADDSAVDVMLGYGQIQTQPHGQYRGRRNVMQRCPHTKVKAACARRRRKLCSASPPFAAHARRLADSQTRRLCRLETAAVCRLGVCGLTTCESVTPS